MSNVVNDFSMTEKDLERCQRRVPVHAIIGTLTGEQKIYVQWYMIPAGNLTAEQLQKVEEALAFDEAFANISQETARQAYLCL